MENHNKLLKILNLTLKSRCWFHLYTRYCIFMLPPFVWPLGQRTFVNSHPMYFKGFNRNKHLVPLFSEMYMKPIKFWYLIIYYFMFSAVGTLPRCRIPTSLSHGDYCEPPVELSPDEEHSPFPFPRRRVQGYCFSLAKPPSDHSGMYIYSDPASRTRTNPESFHWISPMQLRKYFRSDSAPQERRGLFSSPFVKRKGADDYAQIIPLEERQPIKQPRSKDKKHHFHRNDSHNSISSSSTADSQHSRQGSVKSVQLEAVAIAGNIVESPVEVHQVDNDDGTLTKDKPSVSMEAVTNCFDDILKNCDDETIERKCDCPKKQNATAPDVNNENEISNHNKHNINKDNCENCDFPRKCGKEDNNRNSIHSTSGAVTRLSSASTGSGGSLQSPDDKTLTKDSQQPVDNGSTTDVPEVGTSETPKIESFMLNKTVENELKCDPPACDSPDLGVDDTSPTGMFPNNSFTFLLLEMCL